MKTASSHHLAALLCSFTLGAVGLGAAGCGDNCSMSPDKCEGNSRVYCGHGGGSGRFAYSAWHTEDCTGANPLCVEDGKTAGCVSSSEPCDPATFTASCVDEGHSLACHPLANYGQTYPTVLTCASGLTCPGSGPSACGGY